MRKIIYTAISDNYDSLKDPTIITPGWEYICYTNNKSLKSNIWHTIYLDSLTVKEQRKIKIIPPFENYDICIWIDGSMTVNCNLDEFIKEFHKGDFTLMSHLHRDCIYKEGLECVKRNKDLPQIISEQMNWYKSLHYPENNGMVATGVIIRNNTSLVKKFCDLWWAQVSRFSKRDQLSFNFVAHYENFKYNMIPFGILKTEFILNKHN